MKSLTIDGTKYTGEQLIELGLDKNVNNRSDKTGSSDKKLMERIAVLSGRAYGPRHTITRKEQAFSALKDKVISAAKKRVKSFAKALQDFSHKIDANGNSKYLIGLSRNGEYKIVKKGIHAFFAMLGGVNFKATRNQIKGFYQTRSFTKKVVKKGSLTDKINAHLNRFQSTKYLFKKLHLDEFSNDNPLLKAIVANTDDRFESYKEKSNDDYNNLPQDLVDRISAYTDATNLLRKA